MGKRIFVLYTGGTIGMSASSEGLRPDPALADKAGVLFSDGLDFHWHTCSPLIDSSAVTLANWRNWLAVVAEKLVAYDGVLVLHGTDTLAYTANIFALALQGLGKPVVLTGSQRPYGAEGSDAPLNLATAAAAFGLEGLRQVAVAFNGKLFAAVGGSKTSTEEAEGFDNPHFGALAQWSQEQGWRNIRLPAHGTAEQGGLRAWALNPQARVACYTLVPGYSVQAVSDGLSAGGADAVVLQSYGHGNAPDDAGFIRAVQHFTGRGGLLLNISQVKKGCAAPVYAQGSALRRAGAVNGGKANLETATALLTLAVSNGWGADVVESKLKALGLA